MILALQMNRRGPLQDKAKQLFCHHLMFVLYSKRAIIPGGDLRRRDASENQPSGAHRFCVSVVISLICQLLDVYR